MLSLEVSTLENQSMYSTLSSICKDVRTKCQKSASRAVKMQLTLHATRRTPHARRLALGASNVWSVKNDVFHPGIVGMWGSMVVSLRPCVIREHTPPVSASMQLHNTDPQRVCPFLPPASHCARALCFLVVHRNRSCPILPVFVLRCCLSYMVLYFLCSWSNGFP